jgi:hypothetical protein
MKSVDSSIAVFRTLRNNGNPFCLITENQVLKGRFKSAPDEVRCEGVNTETPDVNPE